ncbi:uncharacterized protein [Oscarella lobularis]|uniref:uncharacterized protein n=1 Tax=Oscarella lobularis TaxID=121494 RepID=UPI0033142EF7
MRTADPDRTPINCGLFDKDVAVQENQTAIWSFKPLPNSSALPSGISNLRLEDTLKLTFPSGIYNFSLSGTASERHCYSGAGGARVRPFRVPREPYLLGYFSLRLEQRSCGAWTRGQCHAGSASSCV